MDIFVSREEIVHDDEMDFATTGELDAMETVKSGKEGVGVTLHVVVIALEYGAKEFVLRVMDCLDDEAIVAGKVEE